MDSIYYIFMLAFIFAFSFFMNYITYDNFECFLLWLLIISSFFIWTGLLPLWILILLIIINVFAIGLNRYNKRGNI